MRHFLWQQYHSSLLLQGKTTKMVSKKQFNFLIRSNSFINNKNELVKALIGMVGNSNFPYVTAVNLYNKNACTFTKSVDIINYLGRMQSVLQKKGGNVGKYDINRLDDSGNAAIHQVHNDPDMLWTLVANGANLTLANGNGYSILHISLLHGWWRLARMILNRQPEEVEHSFYQSTNEDFERRELSKSAKKLIDQINNCQDETNNTITQIPTTITILDNIEVIIVKDDDEPSKNEAIENILDNIIWKDLKKAEDLDKDLYQFIDKHTIITRKDLQNFIWELPNNASKNSLEIDGITSKKEVNKFGKKLARRSNDFSIGNLTTSFRALTNKK